MDLRKSIQLPGKRSTNLPKRGTMRICAWRLDPRSRVRSYVARKPPEAKFYVSFCVFVEAGFVAEGGTVGTSEGIFFAQRAATIFRACAVRSSGVSLAHRALPPS